MTFCCNNYIYVVTHNNTHVYFICEVCHCISIILYTQDGWTPLMTASYEGHVDIVRILIEAKAQINMQEEVCCSYIPLENTLHNTSSYTIHCIRESVYRLSM